jgi:hypothetical protein
MCKHAYIRNPVDFVFLLTCQFRQNTSDHAWKKVSESLFQSPGFFNLFKIIYTILPVEDLAPNHKVSKPRLGLPKSEARPKPTASPHQGWAGLGLGWAQLGRLRA